jgi:hypothetical protein
VLLCFLDRDNVHKTSRIVWVGADLSVDFDEALHDDGFRLARVEGILQTAIDHSYISFDMSGRWSEQDNSPIPYEDDEGHTIAGFVWTRASFGCIAVVVRYPFQ